MGFALPVVLKGLGVAGAVSAAATGIVFREEIYVAFGGEFSQKSKEKKLNIDCGEEKGDKVTCSVKNGNLLGFTKKTDSQITVSKNTNEDPERFPGGAYVITGTTDKDGNYKIKEKTGGGFELEKVEDLTKQELCKKVKLTCQDQQSCSSSCTITPPSGSWKTNLFKDSNNYAKDATITGISSVTIETATDANADKYYGKNKFKFSGTAGTITATKGTITITTDKGYSIKYIPDLKDYAFVQIEN